MGKQFKTLLFQVEIVLPVDCECEPSEDDIFDALDGLFEFEAERADVTVHVEQIIT